MTAPRDAAALREEIRVISLLGGTHGFVRRPFIYMGVWFGLSAGVFTLVTLTRTSVRERFAHGATPPPSTP